VQGRLVGEQLWPLPELAKKALIAVQARLYFNSDGIQAVRPGCHRVTAGGRDRASDGPSAPRNRRKDLASKAIDSLTVEAPDDKKASRKRRLLKGPEEFREVRVDRPKGK
jgi:hypothetical protein